MSLLERALQLFTPTFPARTDIAVLDIKAATGPGVAAYTYATPLWSLRQTPQQMAYQAAVLFATHDMIRKAESAVSGRAGSVAWHLEVDEENVDDTAPPAVTAIRNLVEKPQAGLPMEQRQPGMGTRRGLWTTTIRHMGLTGTSFWFLDQTDALAGIPLGVLYIAPWRMFPVVNERSALLGWSLDKPVDEGGTPLRIEDVLPFYLQPPDMGYFASGLVQAASSKIPIGPIVDRHIASVIGNGGRLTGLISPKENTTVTDDQWRSFLNDYRNITSDPNAAQRLQIVKGPVDYVRTAATMAELGVIEVDKMTNEAILTLWGVPGTQVGHLQPAGLNSGGTKAFDEAVLWQGAIAARLESFYETVQYGLLDRFKGVGIDVELVLDPPSFDDDAPLYAKAEKAQVIPLTNDERRELVGREPLDPAVYGEWGQVIVLPGMLTEAAGPGIAEKQAAQQAAQEAAAQAQSQAALQPPVPPLAAEEPPIAKASVAPGKFAALRRNVDENTIPRTKRAVAKALQTQKADIIEYLKRVGLDHLRRKNDFRWNSRKADEQLKEALVPEAKTIVRKVTAKTHAILAAKATVDEVLQLVLDEVLAKGGDRITAINRTTRDAVAAAIHEALADAQTIGDVINAVNALPVFDEYRAEMIARTETMFAYNSAALDSYGQMGVETVQAIDGEDFDETCAARDGQVYSVEEASTIEDHPNGTLDWVPVVPDEEPAGETGEAADAPTLTSLEDQYHFSHEQGAIFGANGRAMTPVIEGERGVITLTNEQSDLLRQNPGATFSHSHPGGDVGFSVEDIQMAAKYRLGEIRAVTENAVYTMRPGFSGWPARDVISGAFDDAVAIGEAARKEWEREWSETVWQPYRERLGGKAIDAEGRALLEAHSKESVARINAEYNDAWEIVADKYRLDYLKTPR